MSNDSEVRYEFKTVHAMRGLEARTAAKWAGRGWTFESQEPDTLRTKMTFKRVRPKASKTPLVAIGALLGIGILGLSIGALSEDQDGTDPKSAETRSSAPTDPPTAVPSPTPTDSPTPTPTPTPIPSETPTPTPSEEPQAPQAPAVPDVLTIDNSDALRVALEADSCDQSLITFVKKYRRHQIEFDGSITAVNVYDAGWPYGTIADILLAAGDDGSNAASGPAFQFSGVSVDELPDFGLGSVDVDKKYTFVAEIDRFNPGGCLLILDPISARAR
jgi:hypothetical protein